VKGRRNDLSSLALTNAADALAAANPRLALEWLDSVLPHERPSSLEGEAAYQYGKQLCNQGAWAGAADLFAQAQGAQATPLYQHRLALTRSRSGLLDDSTWVTLRGKVDAAERLPADRLTPDLAGVYACGAYHAYGRTASLPWSRALRLAKSPGSDPELHVAAVRLAGGFMCRFILEETRLLEQVDAVAPIPANPWRYADRHMSLPDELAKSVERQLGVPCRFDAIRWTGDDVELRGLSWEERRKAIREQMAVGSADLAIGRNLLLVDDVMTSGATLREAARILLNAGVGAVFGIVLSHTEG
jgi:hypothetical protein